MGIIEQMSNAGQMILKTFGMIGTFLFNNTLGDLLNLGAEQLPDGFITDIIANVASWLNDSLLGGTSLGVLFFGNAIFVLIYFSIVKWIIGIVM